MSQRSPKPGIRYFTNVKNFSLGKRPGFIFLIEWFKISLKQYPKESPYEMLKRQMRELQEGLANEDSADGQPNNLQHCFKCEGKNDPFQMAKNYFEIY